MTRLLLAAAVAMAGFAGAAPANAGCETVERCCVLTDDLCVEIQRCVCPYDGCWCLPVPA